MKGKVRQFTVGVVTLGMLWAVTGMARAEGYGQAQVAYPEGYRSWTHVKSMVIQQGHPLFATFGGIHHIYANDTALAALSQGVPCPDGAVLVFDLLEARSDNHAIVEGPRKVIGVMQKDARLFAATGGWGFEGFKGESRERVVTDPKKDCFDCHAAQRGSDYLGSEFLFSRFRQ